MSLGVEEFNGGGSPRRLRIRVTHELGDKKKTSRVILSDRETEINLLSGYG
jgi:hypothetical protein